MSKILAIFLLFLSITTFGRETYRGTPQIRNYHKSDYKADTQNWGICQDTKGFIHFANNDGLLSFDGVEWNLTKISSISPLRSILVDSKNRICAGLINDFGIVSRSGDKPSSYVSLKNLLPEEYRDFDEIWRIHETGDGIIFQCYDYIFLYANDTIEVIKPLTRFRFSFRLSDKILVHEPGAGLYEIAGNKLVKADWWEEQNGREINSVLESDNEKILVGTTNEGVFIFENGRVKSWETPVNELLKSARLYSAVRLPDNRYAFGTILRGLIIADSDGNILQTLNTERGLQNNTILSLFVDNSENLWLGLDNGIDYVEINSPLSYTGSNIIGTGYCCRVFNGNLYLGTNQGLYVVPFDKKAGTSGFELVDNTAGQVWTLEVQAGQLLCGHHNGTYLVNGTKASKISGLEGAWKFIPVKGNPQMLIGGHYNGLALFENKNDRWTFLRKIKGFEESSRYLFQDMEGFFWIGHSGRGIIRLKLNDSFDKITEIISFNDEAGLPSPTGNILFEFDNRIFVSTDEGIFKYDDSDVRFIPSVEMNEIFGSSGKIKYVASASSGYTWFIAESESGYLRKNEDMTYTRVTVPLRKLKDKFVNEFEFIYPFDTENIFMGIEEGFVNYNPSVPKLYNREFSAYITRVETDYLDYPLYLWGDEHLTGYEFPWKNNSFRFYFASPFFENERPLMFSWFLENFSQDWSAWSTENYKDFNNLSEGSYEIKLKARNSYGVESEPASFKFEISAPWWRSTYAWFIYVFLFTALIYSVVQYVLYRAGKAAAREKEKLRREMEEQQYRHRQQSLLSEKKILDLENEKLRSEMVYRDKELANQTMAIIEKNKFLKRIHEELYGIQDFVVNDQARAKISGLKKKINKEIDIKQQNKIFESYFDEANEEFFRRLKDKFPDLTPYDLRICAFIKMDIPTKEIATILNISYRGAEVSRYRLRKKLNLPREINLSSFLAGF